MLKSPNKISQLLFLFSALALFLSLSPRTAEAATVTISGEVPEDLSFLTIDVTVMEIPNADLGSATKPEEFYKRLYIFLPLFNKNQRIQFGPKGDGSVNTNESYYWEGLDAKMENNAQYPAQAKNITYKIKLQANPKPNSGIVKSLTDLVEVDSNQKKNIRVLAEFYKVNGLGALEKSASSTETGLYKLLAKPAQAPMILTVEPGHKSLNIDWDQNQVVTYTDAVTQRTPSQMLVMIFKTEDSPVALSGKIPLPDGRVEANGCSFAASSHSVGTEEDCIKCDNEANQVMSFVDAVQENPPPGIQEFKLLDNSVGQYSITALELGKTYTVVLQYKDGVKQSVCHTITPKENHTLTEVNGEAEAVPSDPRCFIATASMEGWPQQLDAFRWARDNFLLPYDWGQVFVQNYYERGEGLAQTIRSSAFLKGAFWLVLWPIGSSLLILQKVWPYHSELLLALAVLALIGLLISKARRQIRE
ncbi:MAG: hypothetical protein KA436_11875 [Oligoflexales bacterium]|nr:hypothetical protein [Oligoflexales bacterium]